MSLARKFIFQSSLFFLYLLALQIPIQAADHAGYSGAFLRLGTTARSLAMGGGFTAELDHGFTAYHNPAGIAFLPSKQASFSYHFLTLDRRFITTSFATHLPPTAGLGIAWVSAGVDGIDGRTSSGERTQSLSTSENAVYLSFAQKLSSWLAVGINVKILYNQLPMNDSQLTGKGIGFDVGMMSQPIKGMTLAFMIKDLNSSYQWNTGKVFAERGRVYKESFPTLYRLGTNYQYRSLYLVGDIGVIASGTNILGYTLRGGLEYAFRENYYLRTGIGNGRLAVGLGMNYTFIKKQDAFLDYALVIEPATMTTGLTHVFTYAFHF